MLLSKRAKRTLTARGIELGGMFYASDELMALRSQLCGQQSPGRSPFHPLQTPGTWGRFGPSAPWMDAFVLASAIDPVMKGMTEYQWKVLKRAVRDRFDRPEHQLSLAAGRNAIRDVVEETLQKPSRKRRSRVMRFFAWHHVAVLRKQPSVRRKILRICPPHPLRPSPQIRLLPFDATKRGRHRPTRVSRSTRTTSTSVIGRWPAPTAKSLSARSRLTAYRNCVCPPSREASYAQ